MDIKLTHTLLSDYLKTSATPQEIADSLSLCGPTVDRLHKIESETIYDIEIITNRIDSASAFGVAREAAAILPQFDHQTKLINNPQQLSLNDLGDLPDNPPVTVQILDQSLIPRFTAIALEIEIKPSPTRTKKLLEHVNQRPLNNIIDVTNELTLRFGQPTHVFDLDKIKGNLMKLRQSKKGETITTLDGKIHTLKGGDIIIEDGSGNLIDLCGIMGGILSAVDQSTKRILFFVQNYDGKRIRRTSLYTQQRTLAAQIFEKSPDPEMVLPTLLAGVNLFRQHANAKIISNLIDIYPNPPKTKILKLNIHWLTKFIGIDIPSKQVEQILSTLGFETKIIDKTATVTVPTWRLHDISIKEDLAEEIARVIGYFRLPSVLPPTTLPQTQTDPLLKYELVARKYLSHLGFTEIYNYALTGKQLFEKTNLSVPNIKVNNPLSRDFEYMRTSLLPSLLFDLEQNTGKAEPPFRLFELSNIYLPQNDSLLPQEISTLALVTQGLDFLTTKGYIEALFSSLHLPVDFSPLKRDIPPFIAPQSAEITIANQVVGHIGPVMPKVADQFQLNSCIIAELNFQSLSSLIDPILHFKAISAYPSILADLTLKSIKPVGLLLKQLQFSHPQLTAVTYLDSYQNKHTFRLEFTSFTDNLTKDFVEVAKDQIVENLKL